MSAIKYLSFSFDKNGRRPEHSESNSAHKNMPPSVNISILRFFFLGLQLPYITVLYLSERHHIHASMNDLLIKDSPWKWSTGCQSAFKKIKCLLSFEFLLSHYNPTFDVIAVSDASEYGIGSVISQLLRDCTQKIIARA